VPAALPYGEYLYQAAATECGLVLRTNDVPYVIRKLKDAQSGLGDDDLDLAIFPSPIVEGDIWIIKRPLIEVTDSGGRGRPRLNGDPRNDRPPIDESNS